jgi:hypothetical protein
MKSALSCDPCVYHPVLISETSSTSKNVRRRMQISFENHFSASLGANSIADYSATVVQASQRQIATLDLAAR